LVRSSGHRKLDHVGERSASAVSVDHIRTLAATVGHPVFWVGPKPGYTCFPSSVRQWTFEPAIDLILHEQGRLDRTGPRPVVEVWPSYTTTLPNEPVIDLRGLAQLR
jgi:hypothetical protein